MRPGAWCLFVLTACQTGPASRLENEMAMSVLAAADGGQCSFSYPTYPPLADFWCDAEARRVTEATGCSTDADCELAVFDRNCIGFGGECERKAVLKTSRAAYEQDLASRVTSFCSSCGCFLSGSCLPVVFSARCINARCEASSQ
jgi:hypothetical protein